jgi:hypothetical protein
MKQNKGKTDLKERGPVWKIKIGIHSSVSGNKIQAFERAKKMKLKVILN